ncbi:MAG: hypothetical protein IKU32_08715 [Clostridia bacterium]|nr:hypothetical protein [Clostridia bacterium]
MSIVSTLPVFLLSNSLALNKLLGEDCSDHVLSQKDAGVFWQRWVSLASTQRDSSRPGHVFENRWALYKKRHGVGLLGALDCVGKEYLKVENRRLYVREASRFSRWQNLRSRMSMLPVKCRMLYRHRLPMSWQLAHPLVPALADFITREGLNETHLHMFACLEPEFSWLKDLRNVTDFLHKEVEKRSQHEALYMGVHPDLTPERMVARMRLARYIRAMLLRIFDGTSPEECVQGLTETYRAFVAEPEVYQPLELPEVEGADIEALLPCEMKLWQDLFDWQAFNKPFCRELEFFAHVYLLIQNEYIHLRRQREERSGFDAFNEVEMHKGDMLQPAQYFEKTLNHILQNTEANSQTFIELRVSPWVFCRLGNEIVQAWNKCCELRQNGVPHLVLVVHFIKKGGTPEINRDSMVLADGYAEIRQSLLDECVSVARYSPYFCNETGVSVGIDAAGDEMKIPPAVFAPVYRLFERETGICYRTYHCGEDFHHLVGGIRAVYDAVQFLNLREGNRVGHATAIGINPQLWKQDMPDILVQKKGDLLLDLIFAWRMLTPSRLEAAALVEQKLMPLAQTLLQGPISPYSLLAFYDARHLLPEKVRTFLAEGRRLDWSPNPEEELVINFCQERGVEGLKLLNHWYYDADSRRMQDELEELELDFLDDATLVFLQQRVQRVLNERNVIIETLPVSNLRISQYRDIREHHLLRWLKVPGVGYEGDEEMTVCMGSDDPGIFASDLKNEFYHVYACLTQAGLSPAQCMSYIRRLNDAGRIYAFRPL